MEDKTTEDNDFLQFFVFQVKLDIVFQNSTPQKIANLRQTRGVNIRVVNCLKQRESYFLGGQYKT